MKLDIVGAFRFWPFIINPLLDAPTSQLIFLFFNCFLRSLGDPDVKKIHIISVPLMEKNWRHGQKISFSPIKFNILKLIFIIYFSLIFKFKTQFEKKIKN